LGSLSPADLLYFLILLVVCFQFTKGSRLRVPVMVSVPIMIMSQVLGANRDLIYILSTICMDVAISTYVIRKDDRLRLPIIIFSVIFIITQAIGYGFNVIPLKVYMSTSHTSISLASIAISAILTFIIHTIMTKYSEPHKS